ncbi:MAG: hypothetical protein LIO45_04345 [Clostridiales bacterium]|nr:hypothetical protein [Clostridiales bacterium]
MTGWIILLGILLLLFLLTLVRVGVEFSYGEEGVSLRIRLGRFRITLLPQKPKPEKKNQKAKKTKPKKEKKKKEPKAEPVEEQKKGGLPLPLMELISLAIDAVGQLLSRLQIDTLEIRYTIAGKDDPANAAIQYGMICAGAGGLVPVLENTFYCIKRRDIDARVDFEARESLIWLRLALSIRIGQVLSIALRLGWRFLRSYLAHQKENQNEQQKEHQEGTNHGTEASDQ